VRMYLFIYMQMQSEESEIREEEVQAQRPQRGLSCPKPDMAGSHDMRADDRLLDVRYT
jgi:hypothetical protein